MKFRFAALALCLPLLLAPGLASALEVQPYAAASLQQAQAAGKAVALHFHADWCPTCKAQEKAFQALKSDPQLKDVTVMVVDYDKERDLKKALGVRSQSVIIVYKGSRETARVGGETDPAKLKVALASAL
jgi:thiol:disulfide interchange protein